MDIDKLMELTMKAVNADTLKTCAQAGQITLGELAAHLKGANQEAIVQFDDGTYPGGYHSYRGYYDMIAVDRGKKCTVADLLELTTEATGKTFEGYKGGNFMMTKMTPVWLSEYGCSSGNGIIDVMINDDKVILKIGEIED